MNLHHSGTRARSLKPKQQIPQQLHADEQDACAQACQKSDQYHLIEVHRATPASCHEKQTSLVAHRDTSPHRHARIRCAAAAHTLHTHRVIGSS
ncbi:MAG: hypothetical protein KDI69_06695 [Xanthomonadales bacterium]|nr:hypothetical protein [Xanthomonadales bacterium]